MDAAEDLSGQVDPVCAAFADAVEDRTPGAVDAGQAKDAPVAAQRRPSRISRVAIGAAALDRPALIDPRGAPVGIGRGRRTIAAPIRWREREWVSHGRQKTRMTHK